MFSLDRSMFCKVSSVRDVRLKTLVKNLFWDWLSLNGVFELKINETIVRFPYSKTVSAECN